MFPINFMNKMLRSDNALTVIIKSNTFRKKVNFMINNIKWIGALLIVVVIVFLLGNLATLSFDLGTLLGIKPTPAKASVVSSQTIVSGILPMGQLVSISAQVAKANIFVGVQQGALNACGFSANHVAQVTVDAGIDLTQLKENGVSYDAETNTYTLTLPAAQLTSCRIDYFEQYDRSTTTCGDWETAEQLAKYDAMNEFVDDTIEGGILDRAQTQAQLTLGNFIKFLHKAATGNDAEVKINFDTSNASTLPASCSSEIPAGWVYDAASNVWARP